MKFLVRAILFCLLLVCASSDAHSQVEDPFGGPVLKPESAKDLPPRHPDGETPSERMLSLVHTDSLPEFDRAEIFAVSSRKRDPFSDDPPKPPAADEEVVPVRPYGTQALIHARVVIVGNDCKKLRQAWRKLTFDRLGGAFCHYPAYAMRLYRDDLLLYETTICWDCSNFYLPQYDPDTKRLGHGWYGFTKDEKSEALLKLFRTFLAHPKL